LDKRRAEKLKRLKGLYKHFCDEDSRRRCYYCGDPSDTLDHVPAIDWVYSLGPDSFEKQGIKLWLVPACRECNGLCNDKPLHTVTQRANFLWRAIENRYRKVLNGMSFTESELKEYGPNLRGVLRKHRDLAFWVERRLSFLSRQFFDE